MPIIQFNMMKGRTDDQKKELVKNVTATVADTLSVKPETVRILIHELGEYDFAVGGVPMADRNKKTERSDK